MHSVSIKCLGLNDATDQKLGFREAKSLAQDHRARPSELIFKFLSATGRLFPWWHVPLLKWPARYLLAGSLNIAPSVMIKAEMQS